MKKKILSLFLVLTLCLSLLPTAAFAESTGEAAQETRRDPAVGDVYTVGEDTVVQNEEVRNAAVQAAHVDHPICGAAHTDIGDHTEDKCANVTWTAWNGEDAIPYDSATKAAYVYLSGNAERTEILTVAAGYKLYLCLNGYSLTKTTEDSNPSFEGIITIYKGAQFTLCDCRGGGKITHAEDVLGRGVRCGDSSGSATFAMFGGEISGNRVGSTSGAGQDGAGVEVHNAIFNMYGGRIADNHVEKTSNDGGGGVHAYGSGSFTMYGGEISGNTSAGDGGGVSVVAASFTMKGGSITNNTASAGDGGGAALYNDTFELSGGTISDNSATKNGGGLYYYHYQSAHLTVSGSVNITGNKQGTADSNVYLTRDKYLVIGAKGLKADAKIGVTYADPIASGSYVTVARGANKGYTEGNITSDAGGTYSILREGDTVNLYNGLPHEHPICGATHTDINGHTGECSNVKWTAWDGVSDITYDENNTAYVYLTTNAERDSTLEIAQGNTLYLCLNGHSLTKNKSGNSVINIGNKATLSLCDCSDAQTGKLTHGTNGKGLKYEGHGVNLGASATFNMYGGSITGNEARTGGGVELNYRNNNSKFNMYGGSITNNTADNGSDDGGGGVHILAGTFTMYGGSITGNNAVNARCGGGGVYLGNTVGKFHMKGGSITDNTAKNGGGVYMNANGVSVSGSVNITGNKNADGKDENVYLNSNVYFYINTDGLNADAKIGVTYADEIASGDFVYAAYCSNRSYTEGSIFSDKPEYDTLRWNDYVRLYNGLPHVHPDCGDKTCTNTFHTNNNMWTPVSTEAELNAIAKNGSCYLANDIELSSTYTPKDGVHLCLNGYSLIAKGNFDVITLPDGDSGNDLSLDVCDCNASGNGNAKITHADGKTGRGVYMGTGTNFDLYGGSITGNHVNGNGGGIYAKGVNFVDMSTGASITGNTATGNGGGVMLTGSSFNDGSGYGSAYFCTESSGGTISDNTAEGYGGGVYISGLGAGSSFTPCNVIVTGNKAKLGGGVYVSSTGRLSARNGAYITGNENAEGAADNVYLVDGKTIGFWSALDDGAVIGVTTEKKLANGGYAVIADGDGNLSVTLTETDLNAFTSDDGYGKLLKDNKIFFTTGALHEHAICGASGADCDHTTTHSDELWQPLTYDAATMTLYCGGEAVKSYDYRILAGVDDTYIYYKEYQLPAGNYYLAENIALNGGTANEKTYVGGLIRTKGYDLNVNLCLNGFTLSATNPNTPLLSVPGTQTLTLSDCQGGGKIQTDAGGYNVLQVFGDEGKGGTFTMYGGTLSGARTGVYTYNYGVVNLFGGTITGNECGLDIGGNGSVTVGGTVNITGNTKQNLYLYTGGKTTAIISIDTTLTKDSRIGISSALTKNGQSPIHVATGANNDTLKYTDIFTADAKSDGYVVVKDGTELVLKKHTHNWSYTADDETDTITATCSNDDGNCPLNGDGGSVTISKPKHEVYRDGKDATAKVTQNSWAADTVSDVTYKNYTGDETPLSPAPTDAGHYIASITVGGKTAWVDYEIGKATPTADDFNFTAPTDPTYNGEVKSADFTWVDGVSGMGKIGIRHYNESGEMVIPKDAGTYTVKITVAEGTNYKAAEAELTKDSWTFTILQADYTGQKSDKTIDIVKGRSTAQSGTLTAADFFPEGTELPAGAKIASVTPASGTMMASVTVNDGTLTYTSNTNITATENESYTVTISTTNYNNFTVTLTFRPADKQPQTNFGFKDVVDGKVAKVYGTDKEFTLAATGAATGSTVTYESTDTNVATVDGTGKVTIKGAGTAVIKATASATDDYAEATAQYTLTVSPKTLTKDDLEFTSDSTFTKVYDGDTACTTATVRIRDSAKVNQSDVLPTVTGTYAYDSKDVKDATKVTFTSAASDNTNYILPEGLTVENAANITKRVLTVGKVDTISKTYNTLDNALDCVTGIELIGTVSGETLRFYTSAETGGDYGIYETKFDNANAGQNKTITGTVALLESSALASNYTFKVDGKESSTAPFTATGEITPADGGSKGSVERTQKFTDENPKTETIAWQQLLPAGQTWNYVSEYYSASSVTVDHRTDDNGALTYTITGGKENDVVVFTVSAKCNNYNDFTYTVRVTLTARDSQALEFKGVENGKVTKTYGNQPFTQTVTGEKTDVTYASSNERVATVDNGGKVTIVGAGDTTITATAAQTNDYASASASYTLTVNKLRIAVPAPGKNKLEYDGTTQTYMPDRLDTAYCTITDNTAKDVIDGDNWKTADVTLRDPRNTEWDEGVNNTTPKEYRFRITPKPITVKALDKKITTGQPAPELTNAKLGEDYTITGLIGSDSLGSIVLYYADPANTAATVMPDTGKAGTYAIVAKLGGGTSNPNYAPMFVSGTLTIANRPSSGGSYTPTYPVNTPSKTENGSISSNVKNASKGDTVTITVKPDSGYVLDDLTVTDKNGNELKLTDKGNGKYTFIMPAGKVEVKANFTKEVETSPFADVATDAYYYEAVKWAAEQGITGGTGGGLFSPDSTCTRAQIVTFLWRAAGSPEPKAMSGFSDVPENSYYAKAVAWAVENGITVGTSSTTFSPEATCTRAQSVTFLFRAAKASADGTPAFSDVTANAYYAEAVKWATDNGITNGIGGGLFGSNNDCTRAQIVTFLWRLYAGK